MPSARLIQSSKAGTVSAKHSSTFRGRWLPSLFFSSSIFTSASKALCSSNHTHFQVLKIRATLGVDGCGTILVESATRAVPALETMPRPKLALHLGRLLIHPRPDRWTHKHARCLDRPKQAHSHGKGHEEVRHVDSLSSRTGGWQYLSRRPARKATYLKYAGCGLCTTSKT